MPTLNWIGKDAVINHDKEVPFRLLKKIKSASVGNSQNLILHGDNLHALKALMPYYTGKIDCVFIDPPYNTGSENWIYNDKVNSPKIKKWLGKIVKNEAEDLCRHDKWLCMMYPRLKLLHDLMSDEGIISITIDDNESYYLRILLNIIFGDNNYVGTIAWKKTSGDNSTDFCFTHDNIIVFKKSNITKLKGLPLSTKTRSQYKNPDNDSRGDWASGDYKSKWTKEERPNLYYGIKNPNTGEIIYPDSTGNTKRVWAYSKESHEENTRNDLVYWGKNGKSKNPVYKRFFEEGKGMNVRSVWDDAGTNDTASKELKELFNGKKMFPHPKPVALLRRIIQMSTTNNGIILDSFAGSGTTGHAVLDLNKEDGGNRKFILVEMEDEVAKDITAERVKRAIKQYDYKDGFEYCELSKPLFNEEGQIEDTCDFDQFATYIYFTETQTNIDPAKVLGNCIGEYMETEYYLIYKEKGENVLSKSFLKKLRKTDDTKVIYADKCLLDEATLEKHNIIFKQIPYEVKIY